MPTVTFEDVSVTFAGDDSPTLDRISLTLAEHRIGIIGAELSNVEGEMAKFKQQNHLVDLQQTAQAVVNEAANARNKVIEAETQLQVARYLLAFLRDQSHGPS